MLSRTNPSTVLLSDQEGGARLAEALPSDEGEARWFTSWTDLLARQPLSSIGTLVLHSKPVPRGMVLVTLGRLNLEYPAIQKLALLEGEPPLAVAEYLASCGVDILLDGRTEDGAARVAASVDKLKERKRWVTS